MTHKSESNETDDYGNEIPKAAETTTVCEIQQQQRSETASEGELSDTRWLGFFPADTELDTGDVVATDGIGTLELIGAPWPVRDPEDQTVSHLEATLRRTAGPEMGS